MKKEIKCYTVFTQRLMATLVLKGFVLVDMRADENGSGKNIFYFKDSPQLREAIAEYQRHR